MSAYIMLINFTQQGIETIKELPNRIAAARQGVNEMGAEIKDIYYTMGQYDGVVVIEAPDDETVAKIALAVGSVGNVRSETLRAYTEDEFVEITSALR